MAVSLKPVAARNAASTGSTPRRIDVSRMSSIIQASICSSDCSFSRLRYSVASADRAAADNRVLLVRAMTGPW